jgi:hypothetical protein
LATNPEPQKSELTLYSLLAICVSLILGIVGLFPGLASVGSLAMIFALASVLLAVLSLREIL